MTTVRIVDTFECEPSLRGELAESTKDTYVFKLLGNSDYILNKTDGYVMLSPTEYDLTYCSCHNCKECHFSDTQICVEHKS